MAVTIVYIYPHLALLQVVDVLLLVQNCEFVLHGLALDWRDLPFVPVARGHHAEGITLNEVFNVLVFVFVHFHCDLECGLGLLVAYEELLLDWQADLDAEIGGELLFQVVFD